jgi:hypothetical protein
MLSLRHGPLDIRIVNEPTYTFGSADNTRRYRREIDLSGGYWPSIHGVLIDDVPLAVVGVAGGATTVHSHSAVVISNQLYLAVGDRVACFSLESFELEWSIEADVAACFGLHFSTEREALICHGEVEISRLSEDGRILWRSGGRDIFTGPFDLGPRWIAAQDFNGDVCRFDYETGRTL